MSCQAPPLAAQSPHPPLTPPVLPSEPPARRSAAAVGGFNPLGKMFAGCPDNAFQKVPPGYAPFTLAQRTGAVVRNGESGGSHCHRRCH